MSMSPLSPDQLAHHRNRLRHGLSDEVRRAFLTRDGDEYGVTIVGPDDRYQAGAGVFVTRVRDGTPAATTSDLKRGMQILAINGQSMISASKAEALQALSTLDEVKLLVQYNPIGFAYYDQGEELRELSALAFIEAADLSADLTTSKGYIVQYMGTSLVESSEMSHVHAAYSRISTAPRAGHKQSLVINMTSLSVAVFNYKTFQKNKAMTPTFEHALQDIEASLHAGPAAAIINSEVINNQRKLVCHIYLFRKKKEAAAFIDKLKDRCERGQDHLEISLRRRRSTLSAVRQSTLKAALPVVSHTKSPTTEQQAESISGLVKELASRIAREMIVAGARLAAQRQIHDRRGSAEDSPENTLQSEAPLASSPSEAMSNSPLAADGNESLQGESSSESQDRPLIDFPGPPVEEDSMQSDPTIQDTQALANQADQTPENCISEQSSADAQAVMNLEEPSSRPGARPVIDAAPASRAVDVEPTDVTKDAETASVEVPAAGPMVADEVPVANEDQPQGSVPPIKDFRGLPLHKQKWFSTRANDTLALTVLTKQAAIGGFVCYPAGLPNIFTLAVKQQEDLIRFLKVEPTVKGGQILYSLSTMPNRYFKSLDQLIYGYCHEPYEHTPDGRQHLLNYRAKRPQKPPTTEVIKPSLGQHDAVNAAQAYSIYGSVSDSNAALAAEAQAVSLPGIYATPASAQANNAPPLLPRSAAQQSSHQTTPPAWHSKFAAESTQSKRSRDNISTSTRNRPSPIRDFRGLPLNQQKWYSTRANNVLARKVLIGQAAIGGFVCYPAGSPDTYTLAVKERADHVRYLQVHPVLVGENVQYSLSSHAERHWSSLDQLVYNYCHEPYDTDADKRPLILNYRAKKAPAQETSDKLSSTEATSTIIVAAKPTLAAAPVDGLEVPSLQSFPDKDTAIDDDTSADELIAEPETCATTTPTSPHEDDVKGETLTAHDTEAQASEVGANEEELIIDLDLVVEKALLEEVESFDTMALKQEFVDSQ
eukprot:TRINITY_DN6182_c0_g1_i5.p1 TRINITY_DN6182_c0_g1~~TRINITY_DN6182_c0_g1_i5.p1  ORF type:complete len:1063 (+),score=135.31 TRINITY_DN6182_c0_g1_i5:202-3189(+)